MTVGTYLVESTTTGDLDPRERAGFWSEHVTSYQCRLDYRYQRTDDFRGGTVRQVTDTYQLVEFWSDKIEYVRTPRQVRENQDEDYRFLIPLAGTLSIRQEGREARLDHGTGSLITLGAPCELLQSPSTRAFVMTIPARELDGPLNRSAPLAAGLDLTQGLGRVLSDMVASVFAERDRLTRCQFDALCDRMVELLCMLVTGDDRPDAPDHLAEVEAMVRRYVRQHASDPGLTGAVMSQDLGWSLRQVQLALQRAGTTPRELIREERLRMVRDRLQNPAYDHMTITDLANASGFSSVSKLSTAVRQRFGTSPREIRHERGR